MRTKFHKLQHRARLEVATQASTARSRTLEHSTSQPGFLMLDDEEDALQQPTQQDIVQAVDKFSATKQFELNLTNFGAYRIDYTRNGRHLVMASERGHVAAVDWATKKLHCEVNVQETCRDVTWLHQETMFAVAQSKWTYIYDQQGTELHCLKVIDRALRLDFLPYHFLLASCSEAGFLHFVDVSVGKLASHFNTHRGRLGVMRATTDGIVLLGHSNGCVTSWSPRSREPLVTLLAHRGPIDAIAPDMTGRFVASCSFADRSVRIWDARNTFRPYSAFALPNVGVIDLDFSQRDFLAAAVRNTALVFDASWKQNEELRVTFDGQNESEYDPLLKLATRNLAEPSAYLAHSLARPERVVSTRFVPFEDVLGVGSSRGFLSMLVPGSGEPQFDAYEANPFSSKRQRREAEVRMLLDKVPVDMITSNADRLAELDEATLEERLEAATRKRWLKVEKVTFTPRFRMKKLKSTTHREGAKQGARVTQRAAQVRTWKTQVRKLVDLSGRSRGRTSKSASHRDEPDTHANVLDRFKARDARR